MTDQENPDTNPEPAAPAAEEAATEQPTAAEQPPAAEEAPVEATGESAAEPNSPEPEPAPEPAAPAAPQAPQPSREERRVAARVKRGARRPSSPEERVELRRQKAAARRRRRLQERERKTTKGEGTPPAPHEPGTPQVRLGTVISDKADKTITVRIDTAKRHRRYRKIVRHSSSLHAHDERNDANQGDRVRVVETRPMSASKRWRLVEILERAK